MAFYSNKKNFASTKKAAQAATSGAFFKLEAGQRCRVVFLSYPEPYTGYFNREIKRTIITGPGMAMPGDEPSRTRLVVALWNLDACCHQVWEFSPTTFKLLNELVELGKYEGYIVSIKREGSGLETKYFLTHIDPADMSSVPEIGFTSAEKHIQKIEEGTQDAIKAGDVEGYPATPAPGVF